ncbi:hypothetical protein D4R78_02300, partial [bacterium]
VRVLLIVLGYVIIGIPAKFRQVQNALRFSTKRIELYRNFRADREKFLPRTQYAYDHGLISDWFGSGVKKLIAQELGENNINMKGQQEQVKAFLVYKAWPVCITLATVSVFALPLLCKITWAINPVLGVATFAIPVSLGLIHVYFIASKQIIKDEKGRVKEIIKDSFASRHRYIYIFSSHTAQSFRSFGGMYIIGTEISGVVNGASYLTQIPFIGNMFMPLHWVAQAYEGQGGLIGIGNEIIAAGEGIYGYLSGMNEAEARDLVAHKIYNKLTNEDIRVKEMVDRTGMKKETAKAIVKSEAEAARLNAEIGSLNEAKRLLKAGDSAKMSQAEKIKKSIKGAGVKEEHKSLNAEELDTKLDKAQAELKKLRETSNILKERGRIEALENRLREIVRLTDEEKKSMLSELGYYNPGQATDEKSKESELNAAADNFSKLNTKIIENLSGKDSIERLILAQFIEFKKKQQFVLEIGMTSNTPEFIQGLITEGKQINAYAVALGIKISHKKTGFIVREDEGKYIFVPVEGRPEEILAEELSPDVRGVFEQRAPVFSRDKAPVVYLVLERSSEYPIAEMLKAEVKLREYMFKDTNTLNRQLLLPFGATFNIQEARDLLKHTREFIQNNINILQARGVNKEIAEKIISGENILIEQLPESDKKIFKDLLRQTSGRITLIDLERIIKNIFAGKEDIKTSKVVEDILGQLRQVSSEDIEEALKKEEFRKALEKALSATGFSVGVNKENIEKLMRALNVEDFASFLTRVIAETEAIKKLQDLIKTKEEEREKARLAKDKAAEETKLKEIVYAKAEKELSIFKNNIIKEQAFKQEIGRIDSIVRWVQEWKIWGDKKEIRQNKEKTEKLLNDWAKLQRVLGILNNNNVSLVEAKSDKISAETVKFIKSYTEVQYEQIHPAIVYDKKNEDLKENLKNLEVIKEYYRLGVNKFTQPDEKAVLELRQKAALSKRHIEILKADWKANYAKIVELEFAKLQAELKIKQAEIDKLNKEEKEIGIKGFLNDEIKEKIKERREALEKEKDKTDSFIRNDLYIVGVLLDRELSGLEAREKGVNERLEAIYKRISQDNEIISLQEEAAQIREDIARINSIKERLGLLKDAARIKDFIDSMTNQGSDKEKQVRMLDHFTLGLSLGNEIKELKQKLEELLKKNKDIADRELKIEEITLKIELAGLKKESQGLFYKEEAQGLTAQEGKRKSELITKDAQDKTIGEIAQKEEELRAISDKLSLHSNKSQQIEKIIGLILKGDFTQAKSEIANLLKKKDQVGEASLEEKNMLKNLTKERLAKDIKRIEENLGEFGPAVVLLKAGIKAPLMDYLNDASHDEIMANEQEIQRMLDNGYFPKNHKNERLNKALEGVASLIDLIGVYRGYVRAEKDRKNTQAMESSRQGLLRYMDDYKSIEEKYLPPDNTQAYADYSDISKGMKNNTLGFLKESWRLEVLAEDLKVRADKKDNNRTKDVVLALVSGNQELAKALRERFDYENGIHNEGEKQGDTINEAQKIELDKLSEQERGIRENISNLEQKIASLEQIEKLSQERKSLESQAQTPQIKRRLEIIGSKIELWEEILKKMDRAKAKFNDEQAQNILNSILAKLTAKAGQKQEGLTKEEADKLVADIKNVKPGYAGQFAETHAILKRIKEIGAQLEYGKSLGVVNPAQASELAHNTAKDVVEAVLNNLEIKITVPVEKYNNFDTLSIWLKENVFIDILDKSDISELIITGLAQIYGRLREYRLKHTAALKPMQPQAKINFDKKATTIK